MSTKQSPVSTKLILSLFTGGIIVGFVLGSIGVYIIMKNNNSKNTNTNTNQTIIEPTVNNNPQKIVTPDIIYTQTGTISSIADNKIILKAQVIENQEVADQNITILINDSTKYQKIDENSTENKIQDISISDLKPNDVITAKAEENIKNKTEFTAKQIILYIE